MRWLGIGLLWGLLLTEANSQPPVGGPDRRVCRKLERTYFRNPIRQTIREFSARPLADQYAIYLCGTQFIHPPALELAGPFAAQGPPAAAFLKGRLAATVEDLDVRDILQVFREMKRQHTYSAASDDSLMFLIRAKSGSISNPYWRDYVAAIVRELDVKE